MGTGYKEKIDIFIKNYFKSLRIKRALILALFWTIATYLKRGGEEIIITITVVIIVTFFILFIVPDFFRKETEKLVERYYRKTLQHDEKVVLICNLEKFNGPTFGTLHIDKKSIQFNPFKENLQNESFLIEGVDTKNINISLCEIKSSIFNRIFFKGLYKGIGISGNGIKAVLRTPEPEKAIEKINKKLCVG